MADTTMSRRSFAKLMAATGAVCAITGSMTPTTALAETDEVSTAEVKHIRTACRGCGKMECCVWVTVSDGRVVRIEGDDSAWGANGNCCPKSQASIQAAYHPDRLHYPMKRTNPKTDNDPGWERLTWDEALQYLYDNVSSIQEKYGKNTLAGLAGTSRMWGNDSYRALVLFAFGTLNEIAANQICKGPRRAIGSMTIANGMHFQANVDRPRVYVQWGTDQTQSNYDDSCRTLADVVQECESFISIDPRKSNMGKEADIHLALRPGTDQAMALGWTNIVMDRGLYDEYLCKYWSNGPFLICQEVEPTGWVGIRTNQDNSGKFEFKTRLLKQSDIMEDGDVHKFMVWNNATNSLIWFDAGEESETFGMFEGQEHHNIPTTGFDYKYGGWVPDKPAPPEGIDPALWCDDEGFEVTLKDGRKVKCKTAWQTYWDNCVAEWTLEKTAEVCDVPAEDIEKACLTWATRIDPRVGNGGLNAQLAPEQCGRAGQTFRTIFILTFITDNWDVPGGNRGVTRAQSGGGFPPYSPPSTSAPVSKMESRADQCGGDRFPMLKWWYAWTDATSVWDAAHTGNPYPIKTAITVAGDFMNQSNANYAFEALMSMDFTCTVDLWETPSARISDLVLPACHWLEVPGYVRYSQGAAGHFGVHQQCVKPPADVIYEGEIARKLFKITGRPYWDPATGDPWEERSQTEHLDPIAQRYGFETFDKMAEEFQKHGYWSAKEYMPEDWGTYRRYLMGYERSGDASSVNGRAGRWDGVPGMKTPTMKCEIWSTIMESIGLEGEELPYYLEPPVSPVSTPELYEEYPFNMTTGRRSPVYFHNEHRQLPWCRELWPVPRMEINPEDAAELGIEQGDWCWIESPWGKIRQVADLYYGVKRGVINCEHQWWYPESQSYTKGYELSSINCLVNKDAQDPISGASQLRAYCVKVYKATPENCPDGKVIPTDQAGIQIIATSDDPRLKDWLPDYEGRA